MKRTKLTMADIRRTYLSSLNGFTSISLSGLLDRRVVAIGIVTDRPRVIMSRLLAIVELIAVA